MVDDDVGHSLQKKFCLTVVYEYKEGREIFDLWITIFSPEKQELDEEEEEDSLSRRQYSSSSVQWYPSWSKKERRRRREDSPKPK